MRAVSRRAGDFRKGLKLDPSEKSKDRHDESLIFESIGREPPKEGEEPMPMPIINNVYGQNPKSELE